MMIKNMLPLQIDSRVQVVQFPSLTLIDTGGIVRSLEKGTMLSLLLEGHTDVVIFTTLFSLFSTSLPSQY